MKRAISKASSAIRCEKGSAAVEFAFIGMLLIAGSLAVFDLGRAFWIYNKLSNAVERAARRSLVQASTNDQITTDILLDFPSAGSGAPLAERPNVQIIVGTEFRTVNVSMALRTVVPVFMNKSLNLSLSRRFPKAPPATS